MKINIHSQGEVEINGKLNFLLFVILCRNTGLGKIAIIKDMIGNAAMGAVFLKIFGISSYWWLLVFLVLVYEFVVVLIGKWMVEKGINHREGGFNNYFNNPQLMKVYEKMGGDKDNKIKEKKVCTECGNDWQINFKGRLLCYKCHDKAK